MKASTMMTALAAALLGAGWLVQPAYAQDDGHVDSEPLRAAADVGFAPFAFKQPSGEITGFSVDFGREIAKRLGRPGLEVVDVNYSAIFAGLFSSRYEMIIAPTNITAERAAQMLFSEPYMPTGLGMLVKKGATISSLDDLEGKVVAVNNGSVSDAWAQENADRYGFTVQRFNKNADAVQAVVVGRAFVNVADAPQSRYIAKQNPMLEVAHVVATGRNFGLVFRKDDAAFRDRVEGIIECMKTDGSLAALHEQWFGAAPDADSSTATVYPGYGAPDFEGYDAAEHEAACG